MTLTDEQREELDEELLLSGFTEGTRRTVLDTLAPLIARMVAEAEQWGRAEALREAADELDRRASGGTAFNAAAKVVRARAPEIRTTTYRGKG